MHPLWIALATGCGHFVGVIGLIVFATGPTDARIEAGQPRTRYDRVVLGIARVMTFPLIDLHRRFPGLIGRGGPPREHLIMLFNSMVWGAAAACGVMSIRWVLA